MKNPYPHFLQTPQWGLAKQAANKEWTPHFFTKKNARTAFSSVPLSFGMLDTQFSPSGVISSILILERTIGLRQKLLYIPRGPWIDWENPETVAETMQFIKDFTKSKKALFVRMEPNVYENAFPLTSLKRLGFKKTDDFVQVHDTVKIPIDKTEEELLFSFHKKHRYNIKLAGKRGLRVRTSTAPADVQKFYDLLQKTESRHAGALHIHPVSYYLSITESLAKSGMIRLYLVEKENRLASASVVFSYGEEAIYMFGASDYEFRRDMPNHLREWRSIQDARSEGKKLFDLWGATMRNDPGEGIKRYKLFYHDKIEHMAGTFDWTPNAAGYALFSAANKLRRLLG